MNFRSRRLFMQFSAFQKEHGVGLFGHFHIVGDEDDAPAFFMLMS